MSVSRFFFLSHPWFSDGWIWFAYICIMKVICMLRGRLYHENRHEKVCVCVCECTVHTCICVYVYGLSVYAVHVMPTQVWAKCTFWFSVRLLLCRLTPPDQWRRAGKRRLENRKGGGGGGVAVDLPPLSPHPPLHRLFPPPPPPPRFLLLSFILSSALFPVQHNAACATILEQRWHEMEVEKTRRCR